MKKEQSKKRKVFSILTIVFASVSIIFFIAQLLLLLVHYSIIDAQDMKEAVLPMCKSSVFFLMSVIPEVFFIIFAASRKSKKNKSLFIVSGIVVILCTLGIIANEIVFNRSVLNLSLFRDNIIIYALMLVYLIIIILTLIGIIRFKNGKGYKALMIVGASFGFVIAAAFSLLNVMNIINTLPFYQKVLLRMLPMIFAGVVRETAMVFFYISFIFAVIASSNAPQEISESPIETDSEISPDLSQDASPQPARKVKVTIKKK